MDYDFYGLCDDQGEKFKKRCASLQKSFIKDYIFALNIINDSKANEMRQEIKAALDDALLTAFNKAEVAFSECKHKVIAIMGQHL